MASEYRAKLFGTGGSQAVRLPRECRFPRDAAEVIARRDGDRVVLEPSAEWPQAVLDCIGELDDDLPCLHQTPITEARDPFGDRVDGLEVVDWHG